MTWHNFLTLFLTFVGIHMLCIERKFVSGHILNCNLPDSPACASTTCLQPNDQHVCPHACGACGFNDGGNAGCFDRWRPRRCRSNSLMGRCQFNQRVRNNCRQTCGICSDIPNFIDNGVCSDRWDRFTPGRCASNVGRCQFNRRVQRNCQQTCGLCFATSDIHIFPLNNVCNDNSPSCSTMVAKNATICMIDSMRDVCRLSCGACQNNPNMNQNPLCTDTSENCPNRFGNDRQARICYSPFGRRRCRLSCGFCNVATGNISRG